MEKENLVIELKKMSNHFFDKQQFQKSGTINLAIDIIEEEIGNEKQEKQKTE